MPSATLSMTNLLEYIAQQAGAPSGKLDGLLSEAEQVEGTEEYLNDARRYFQTRAKARTLTPVVLSRGEVDLLVTAVGMMSAMLIASNPGNHKETREFSKQTLAEIVEDVVSRGKADTFSNPVVCGCLTAVLELTMLQAHARSIDPELN